MHCLNLKITYDCNNNCSYCFSSKLKNENMGLDGLLKTLEDGYLQGCRMLVISGGEPTLYPQKVIKIVERALSLGYAKFTIQTNGSGINGSLADFLNQTKEVSISFSVLGANEKTHDKATGTVGSFKKLISGIKATSKNCQIITNTVISKFNIQELSDIVELVLPFSPTIMQFSIMHTQYDVNYVGLIKSVKAIKTLADSNIINSDMLRTEGITPCLLKGFEKCIGENYWPQKLDIYNHNNSNIFRLNQLESNMRFKANFCKNCLFDQICHGVWIETKDEFLQCIQKGIS